MDDFISILQNNPDEAYDFICNNYYNMSKEELKDIIKELLYAVYENTSRAEHNKIFYDVSLELVDTYTD